MPSLTFTEMLSGNFSAMTQRQCILPGGCKERSIARVLSCPVQAEVGLSADQRAALMAARREMLRNIGVSQQERRLVQLRMRNIKPQVWAWLADCRGPGRCMLFYGALVPGCYNAKVNWDT